MAPYAASGDMLQDFAPEDVNRSFYHGLAELYVNNRPKTDIGQIVFVYMEITRPRSSSCMGPADTCAAMNSGGRDEMEFTHAGSFDMRFIH
ncbi:hypothetical protein DL766_007557 [Monosporascus sp. MC13-8B]|uniref:Uncharacterized protein n=1 Tax=Monosporascus cannonballus TaxID=155416 RepID=A0ABY0HLQ7_9PEZI|nr:hypothetical protein DL762_000229 [Monosporascus cannonballus]RYO99379.1 hypothetical protein DL763_001553 [Monosporascus cannonballus]RYP23140.1 hypothetical protein DL766_007557 [Monosporascus sp. MC13-8B]